LVLVELLSGEHGFRVFDDRANICDFEVNRCMCRRWLDDARDELDAAVEYYAVALLEDFPFALLYVTTADVAWIVAVMHLRREPGYWRGRM